jgi:crossover junction endodeoxyribonuclease RuvC
MRILGIDPGIARVGFGVVDVAQNGALRFVECGMIATQSTTEVQNRLLEISNDLSVIIKKTQPNLVALEKLFFQNNAKTAFRVGESRGVLLLVAAQHKIPIAEFTPLQVKQGIAGNGFAKKPQVQKALQLILKLHSIPKYSELKFEKLKHHKPDRTRYFDFAFFCKLTIGAWIDHTLDT